MRRKVLVFILCLSGFGIHAQETRDLSRFEWYISPTAFTDSASQQDLKNKYPPGLTQEVISEPQIGLKVIRWIYNHDQELTIMEKKEWDWGGVFVSKNGAVYPVVNDLELPVVTWQRELDELKRSVAPSSQ